MCLANVLQCAVGWEELELNVLGLSVCRMVVLGLRTTRMYCSRPDFDTRQPTYVHTKETKTSRKRNEVCGTKSVAKCRKRFMFRQVVKLKMIRYLKPKLPVKPGLRAILCYLQCLFLQSF